MSRTISASLAITRHSNQQQVESGVILTNPSLLASLAHLSMYPLLPDQRTRQLPASPVSAMTRNTTDKCDYLLPIPPLDPVPSFLLHQSSHDSELPVPQTGEAGW